MNQGNSTTQVQTAQAPSWQLPYQQYGLQQATAQYNGVTSPQQLVAGFSPQQNQAISGITSLATNNPTLSAAQNYTQSVLNGQPANNPYLNSEFNQAADTVQNRLESEFANAGQPVVNSLPVQSDEMNNLATDLYGGAYNTGVQQQENALGNAGNVVNNQVGVQQDLFNTGGAVQNLAQQYIQAPQNFLNQYLQQVTGNLGSTATTQQPLSTTQQIAQAGVGAQAGSSIGSNIGSLIGKWLGNSSTGSSVGGLLGALGGAFA